jgi:predicted DCC family thiol-disulfide oxidoreductase YuxK
MILFYDGHCGLCHNAVLFILKHDNLAQFQFAPLQGTTFQSVSGNSQPSLDTMVVQTADGSLVRRSTAWVQVLNALGGKWKIAATVPPGPS